MAKLSQEQATATLPTKTVWVGASAGTGKTYVLTARVLRMMLQGTHPGNIICLTFTKAAAAEMKTRIFQELGRWAVMDDMALIEELDNRVNEVATKEVIARARRLFAEVLDLPGGLQIMTFHSFCQSILGRFPLEASLAPGFEALDDQMAAAIKLEARDSTLKSFSGGKSLKAVAQRVNEDDFDRVMESLMFKSVDLNTLLTRHGPKGLRAAMLRHFDLASDSTTDKVIKAATSDEAFDITPIRALYKALESGSASEKKLAPHMHDFVLADAGDRPKYFDSYFNAFLTQKSEPRKTLLTKGTAKKVPDLVDVATNEQQRLYDIKQQLLTLEMVDNTAHLLALGFEQIKAYQGLKHSRGLVDFDDMINSTVDLLSAKDAAPWILYKMDGGLDHILVDEAQDTNAAQWQVVEALSEEFYAGLGAHADRKSSTALDIPARTIFAVGDVKQSIYSFQKADPKEFVAARERIFSRAEGAECDYGSVPLNKSFRSGGAVLSVVDTTFKKGGPAYDGLTFDGEEIEHQFARTGQAGSVELWPLITEDTDNDKSAHPDDIWQPPIHQEEKIDAERLTALKIANHIEGLISKGVILESKGRAIHAGDILVIVRKRSGFVERLTRALKNRGIAVSGRDRIKLSEEQPVLDILSIIRFVLQPADDLSCAEVLTGPFGGLTQDELFSVAYDRAPQSLWQSLSSKRGDIPAVARAYDFLSQALNAADRGTPFDFIMMILNELDGRRKLMHRLGEEINDALDELLEEAINFERNNSASLQNFLNGFELSDVTIKRDMEEAGSAVRIMTAHGSKGLQAPIVYMPDTTSVPEMGRDISLLSEPMDADDKPATLLHQPSPWIYWTSGVKNLAYLDKIKDDHKAKMLAEYRRLLYVAMTRAEDHLYIAGWQKKRAVSDDSWYKLIETGFDAMADISTRIDPDFKDQEIKLYSVPQLEPAPTDKAKGPEAELAPLPDFFKASAPDEPTPARPLVPSRPDDDEPAGRSPLAQLSDRPFQRGNLIHSLLEWLPELPPSKRSDAAKAFLSRPGHGLTDDQQQTLLSEVMDVLSHKEAHILFSENSRAEVPIAGLLDDGQALSGQVDRLVITEDTIWIIDYKSNQPAPKSVEHIPPIYRRQMDLYRRALQKIYPTHQVRTFLLWTDILTLMEVE